MNTNPEQCLLRYKRKNGRLCGSTVLNGQTPGERLKEELSTEPAKINIAKKTDQYTSSYSKKSPNLCSVKTAEAGGRAIASYLAMS